MKVIDLNKDSYIKEPVAIALGNFDGLHLGHKRLLESMINSSESKGLKKSVLLFNKHTKDVINRVANNGRKMELLISFNNKIKVLEEMGIERVFMIDFNQELMSRSGEDFVSLILREKLDARFVTVGFDYKFGFKASCDSKDLVELGNLYGFKTNVVQPIYVDGILMSSTVIRDSIKKGDLEKANKLLGRKYRIEGQVVGGAGRGHTLGFPTANLRVGIHYVKPKNGVYKTYTYLDGKRYLSVTNIGVNPTFENEDLKIETYILDFSEDIYGRFIEVEFLEFMRDDIKFDGPKPLIEQIQADVDYVRNN